MAPTIKQRMQASEKKRDIKKLAIKKPPVSSNKINDEIVTTLNPLTIGLVYPSGETAFKALLSARFCAAIWSHVTDCDETFNYWEPSHYLLFGQGLQTWEYSPEYALRSYTYLLLHAVPGWLYHQFLQPNRVLIFYFLRCLLGLTSAFCEVYFYKSVCREFGVQIARLLLAFLVFSAGMFISSTAFLPSSFSMYMTLISLGAWYQRKYELAIFATALSSLLSWPFAALIGLPIALDLIFRRKEIYRLLKWSIISLLVILIPMMKIDSDYFGKLVIAPWNIIRYNVFTSHGPDIYGTEPFSFYFINGFLNFNFVFIAALFTPLILWLVTTFVPLNQRNPACLPYSLSILPLFLWCAVFFTQAHKEERFLFPVYPMICLCGAITVDACQKLWYWLRYQDCARGTHYLHFTTTIMYIAIGVSSIFGVARILALYNGYHAPLDLFMELGNVTTDGNTHRTDPINVCIGKEWHRFPSSFFLPDNRWFLRFIQSDFKGQLPKYYSPFENATSILPTNMNDMNKEEMDRYFDIEKCHFMVDLNTGKETNLEPNYSEQKDKWKIIKTIPFLDTANSNTFFRAFFIPIISGKYCTYRPYNLLKSIKHKVKISIK